MSDHTSDDVSKSEREKTMENEMEEMEDKTEWDEDKSDGDKSEEEDLWEAKLTDDEKEEEENIEDNDLYSKFISDVEENVPVISALPPRVAKQENQLEVSSSPAFQSLDMLFQEGKLTGTKVAILKAKYTELHEALKRTRDREAKLLQDAKDFANKLDSQSVELEKADNFPENSNTEVSKMREQLLKHNNELAQTEERQYQFEYKIECLQEEKKIIEREHSRLPKQGEVEKRIKELQTSIEEMRREIVQRQVEAKTLIEDLESTQRQTANDQKAYEKITDELEQLKAQLVQINTLPGQMAKKSDKIYRKKNALTAELEALTTEYQEYLETAKTLESQRQTFEEEKLIADTELENGKAKLNDSERQLDTLLKDLELVKEREITLLGDRTNLDLNFRHLQMEKKTHHDILARKVREKDRDSRLLKKVKLQLKMAEDNLEQTKFIYEKVKSQVNALPKDDGSMVKKREELRKEVEQAKRSLAQQNSLTAVEHVKLEASAAEEQHLLFEQSDLRIEVVELSRLAAIKADEREQKARDFIRAEMKYHRAVEDVKTKKLQILDHQKNFQEMQLKLKEFAKLYDLIKNERNKCVNLIQTSTQKSAEMKEKIKILLNEIEIIRTSVIQKDKDFQKHRLRRMNAIVMRDSLRNEMAKQLQLEGEMKEKREQQKMDMAKLNLMINQGEEQMVKLRKRYEENVQHRNDRGIKLIERNEEVCVFYEKVNVQDQMIRNGNVELTSKEEEIRFLQLRLQEEGRAVQLLLKSMPNKINTEKELVNLQIQLQQCQDLVVELEKNLEDPFDETRVRHLMGKDPTPLEIQTKVEELESRLTEREEQLLEKDLILDQDERLVGRVKKKAEAGKDDTLTLAKSVNSVQVKIKEITRKMMSVVSELSMNQAHAMKLQQEVKEKEAELEECYLMMEKGEPPSQEIDLEWQRMFWGAQKRMEDTEAKILMEQEDAQYKTAGGIYTTAEPRPNAYIPTDENDLPIPRPYGSHAPFKPSETGSSMRHIRKPVPKAIEI
uniref:Cilia- and flagella-associated protein 58 central coiled coil domain-containing protein n=1 Tax=Arion vulgaris TaxID=1028688 RepID=A0A0B6Y001_9EUPU